MGITKPLKKGSKRYWRAIVRAHINVMRLYRDVVKIRLQLRENNLKDLEEAVTMFNDVAKAWLVSKIKKPLMSIVADSSLNLDFTDERASMEVREQRLMRLKVRVKGIVHDVAMGVDASLPLPLLNFFKTLSKEGAYIPDGFLTPFELTRLRLDDYGSVTSMSQD